MKKFGISMAVIIGFIVVFTVSGLIAFHSFPENDENTQSEQAVGANMFSDEDPYANSNGNDKGLLTIITPSIDKSKTVVRRGTIDDIVIYEKTTSVEEIDVGEVEEQKSIFDEPPVKTETEKKPVEKPKTEEKPAEAEEKEEAAAEKVEPTQAAVNEESENENKADSEQIPEEEDEPIEKEVEETPEQTPEEQPEDKVEEKAEEKAEQKEEPKVEDNVPKSQSLPPSMTGDKVSLDPSKQYSDTGI